jgi:CheY-like chemotaxis protein
MVAAVGRRAYPFVQQEVVMGHRGMGVRVLVVDDNEDTAQALAALLEMEDFEARTASSGEAALRVVDDFEPHIAVIDLGMPGVDGYSVCRSLRQKVPACRMVAFSGRSDAKDVRDSEAAGFELHVAKPHVPLEAILALLAKPPRAKPPR